MVDHRPTCEMVVRFELEPHCTCGADERLRAEAAEALNEQAVLLLSFVVDDIDATDLLDLCRSVELDLNAEHDRALAAEARVAELETRIAAMLDERAVVLCEAEAVRKERDLAIDERDQARPIARRWHDWPSGVKEVAGRLNMGPHMSREHDADAAIIATWTAPSDKP